MRFRHLALVGAVFFASADAFVPSVGIAMRPVSVSRINRKRGKREGSGEGGGSQG